jgi:ferredoxin
MGDTFRVTIDRDECISCETCWEMCPKFFEENPDDAFSQVIEEYRVDDDPGAGKAPEELENCVTDAADGCPVEIIHIHE